MCRLEVSEEAIILLMTYTGWDRETTLNAIASWGGVDKSLLDTLKAYLKSGKYLSYEEWHD